MWCALGSPACKELVTLCLHNPCLTLVVRYLLEFSITPNRVFPSQWLVSCIFYNSPDSRSLLFPHCRALLLTAHAESGPNSPYDFSLFLLSNQHVRPHSCLCTDLEPLEKKNSNPGIQATQSGSSRTGCSTATHLSDKSGFFCLINHDAGIISHSEIQTTII